MGYILTRDLEFKSSVQLVRALPAIMGISKMWSEIAPNMPFEISRSKVGNPLRIRWLARVESLDEYNRLFDQMQQRPEYLGHTATIADCADLSTLRDEIWQALG